jgi:hypothetical protein
VLLVAGLSLGFATSAAYGDLSALGDIDTPVHDIDIATEAATGFNMETSPGVGPVVTVTFFGGGTQTDIWDGITGGGTQSGAAGGTGFDWTLAVAGNTYEPISTDGEWSFTNSHISLAIIKVVINAGLGAVAFDNIDAPDIVSAESSFGIEFDQTNLGGLGGTYQYSELIDVGPAGGIDGDTIGDLYGVLTLTFGGAGLTPGSTLEFLADTDLLEAAVPEPAAYLFGGLVCGVVGLGVAWRRVIAKAFFSRDAK